MRAEVTCQEMEVLIHKDQDAMRTDDATILTVELIKKPLRDEFTTLQDVLEDLSLKSWKFSQQATDMLVDIQVKVAKPSM